MDIFNEINRRLLAGENYQDILEELMSGSTEEQISRPFSWKSLKEQVDLYLSLIHI